VSVAGAEGLGALSLPPEIWRELLDLAQDENAERALVERLLDHWCRAHDATFAAIYLEREGRLELELVSSVVEVADAPATQVAGHSHLGLPELLEGLDPAAGPHGPPISMTSSVPLPDGRHMQVRRLHGCSVVYAPRALAAGAPGAVPLGGVSGPLELLLTSSARTMKLRQDLKEQQFQVNYRVVELEALYDVGLAVAATLDLDKLSEEILLRALSLLDARRGALYILEGERYQLERTFGGAAAPWFERGNAELGEFLAGRGAAPAELLPGARYLLAVPIEIEGNARGLLAAGDKESRRGVGPFPPVDRRTLGLFANQAAIALENARLHLQALEKERLESEMQLAGDIQRRILPREAPAVPGYELIGWNRPARQIGGDYYDLFQRQDGSIEVVVGDVSGKGMPAALMVSTLHSALHLLLDQAGFGPPLLELLNRHVLESTTANKFITLMLAELEPASGRLTYMNAGHNPGLLLHAARGAEGGFEVEELGSSGLPIGVLPGSRFQARIVTLAPGDLLCLYTDGITEAESPAEEEFGTKRLVELLRAQGTQPLPAVLEAVKAATGTFSAGLPQGDDQTVVLLRRT
jgi:sigma-B regulation protein RsbU (phosphoserine phosphatase)